MDPLERKVLGSTGLEVTLDLKAAASQFVLAHPAITCIIPGTRFPERVEENFRVIEDEIPADFWAHAGLWPEPGYAFHPFHGRGSFRDSCQRQRRYWESFFLFSGP